MNSSFRRGNDHRGTHLRMGLIAMGEGLLILVLLAGLMYLMSRLVQVDQDASNASALRRGCGVYQISIDSAERNLWVFRPPHAVVRWNMATGQDETSLPSPGMEIADVAHSTDGTTTILCGHEGTAVLHREGEEPKVANVSRSDGLMLSAHVSDDGAIAFGITELGRVFGWNRKGEDVHEFTYDLSPHPAIIRAGVNTSGRRLFVLRSNGTVSFHVTETGVRDHTELHVGTASRAMALSPDETRFVTTGFDGQVRVYDVATDSIVNEGKLDAGHRNAHPGPIIKISPDGRLVAIPTGGYTIVIWDLKSGASVGELFGHRGIARTVHFSPDSERLYSGSYDNTVREWSLETFSQLRIVN